MKRKIPEPTNEQLLKAFIKPVLLIPPAKEGYVICISDGKYYEYIKVVTIVAEKGLIDMSLN